ncbi:hypothetical protein Agub_g8750, partial [Astrephomene gubernaculifera]
FVLLQRHGSSGPAAGDRNPSSSASASPAALAATTAALSAWLPAQLTRLACGGGGGGGGGGGPQLPPRMRRRLLVFLTAHLALGPRGTEVDRMRAVQSLSDLLDVLEAVLYDIYESGEGGEGDQSGTAHDDAGVGEAAAAAAAAPVAAAAAAAAPVADALLQLAFEVMMGSHTGAAAVGGGGGGGGGGQEVVAALLRLQALVPGALRNHLAALSLLTLGAYGKELQGLNLLLHRALQTPGPQTSRPSRRGAPAQAAAADAALTLQPLLAAVAFGTSAAPAAGAAPAAAWPAYLATALQRVMKTTATTGSSSTDGGDGGGGDDDCTRHSHGDLCLFIQCRRLLLSLWAAPTDNSYNLYGDGPIGGGGGAGYDSSLPPSCDLL